MQIYARLVEIMNLFFSRVVPPQFPFRKLKLRAVFTIAAAGLLLLSSAIFAAGSVVKVSKDESGKFILLRDGKPFFINGSGGTQRLSELVANGGNSIRTWGIDSLDEKVDGKNLADRAQELGIGVTAGLWVGHEHHGFNYGDPAMIQKQRDTIRAAVKKWKNHPALLVWGLGNEMEGPTASGDDARIWKELNVLAGIVKEEDPNHPVMTVIANTSDAKIKAILEFYPNIDILGVNAYSGASGVGASVKQSGWQKPFILTEFGPPGAWEVRKTSWGAPIEPPSWEKAGTYYATYTLLMQNAKDICLGSYVFLWGSKQETTSTWYGMFLDTGEKLPTVDAMGKAWNGKWPEVRAPRILSYKTDLAENKVAAEKNYTATVEAKEYQNLPLSYEWSVYAESTVHGEGGEAEPVPPKFPECIVSGTGSEATIKTPSKPGAYRLFVTVRNGKGGASKDNVPFYVQ
jgi:hypothetical protein